MRYVAQKCQYRGPEGQKQGRSNARPQRGGGLVAGKSLAELSDIFGGKFSSAGSVKNETLFHRVRVYCRSLKQHMYKIYIQGWARYLPGIVH